MTYFADLIRANKCCGCGGTGEVTRFVPVEGTYVCSTCKGAGTFEAMFLCDFCHVAEGTDWLVDEHDNLAVVCRTCYDKAMGRHQAESSVESPTEEER